MISVEIYAGGTIVRFAGPAQRRAGSTDLKPAKRSDLAEVPGMTIDLSDDAGTTYELLGGMGGSEGGYWRGEVRFTPSPPADASVLKVATESELVEVPLSHDAESESRL